ncbi:hypothetical protein EJB05_03096, partial [Eragrostis curvula]
MAHLNLTLDSCLCPFDTANNLAAPSLHRSPKHHSHFSPERNHIHSIGASRRWRRGAAARVKHGGCQRAELGWHDEARQRVELLRRGRGKATGGSAQARSTSARPALELNKIRPVLICRSPPTPFQIEDQPSTSNQLLGASVKHDQILLPPLRRPMSPPTPMARTAGNSSPPFQFQLEMWLLKVNSKASMDAIHFRLKSLFPESVVMYLLEESCKHSLGNHLFFNAQKGSAMDGWSCLDALRGRLIVPGTVP